VVDEFDPLSVDPALDIYDERNGFREPPAWSEYNPEFVARYRAAQVERVRRIDGKARELIARHEDAARASEDPELASRPAFERRDVLRRRACEPIMVVYRTMANPACVDRRIDRPSATTARSSVSAPT
jgi:hypothetical protein